MKPNNVTGTSGAGRNDRGGTLLSAQLTEVPGNLERSAPLEELGTQYVEPPRQKRPTINRFVSLSILGVGVLAAILLALHEVQVNKKQTALDASQSDSSSLIKPQAIPLNDLGLQMLSTLSQTNALTVNGDVDIAGSVLLSPTTPPPSGAVAGQLYFDAQKNQIGYYNGSSYVYLQGGSAAVTNNLTTVKNVTNLTKVTDVTDAITNQYITSGITAINGTTGNLAMFDGVGGLTESLISQSGNTLNTGTGVENVTIGSTSGASNTIVQGGTGNVAVNTSAEAGNSGSITIQTGDSSTTAAGNVSIDTGESIITGTQVADKTFEDGVDNMGDATYGDNTTITQSNAEAHGGTHSLAVAVGSNFFPSWSIGDGVSSPPFIIPVSAGHTYAFSTWVRAGTNSDLITASVVWSNDGYAGGGEISQQDFGSVTDVSTGWKQVAGVLTAPAGAQDVGLLFSSSDATSVGEIHYFDDMTVTDLSSSSSMAALNLGATNAQIITIGNSGMLAPTTIYGGGVNIDGGTGFVNISGSNLTETAGGADYNTTSGALDITAATGSTWKVGGSNGTGGDLNIAAGNAGGNGDGGNLIFSGGASAGTGTGGSVIVQPQTDSTSAFQVRNSGGIDLLNVDTSGSTVSIATNGAGTVNVGSIAGSLNFGYTSVGNRQDVGYQDLLAGEQFTASTTGTLTSMSAYIGNNVDASPNNEFQLAIYTDNGSNAPDQYVTSTSVGTITANSWNTLPLNANVTAGTKYWLVFWTNTSIATDNGMVYNNISGSSLYYAYTNGVTFGSGSDNGMPATFPTPSSDKSGSDFYSLYASYSSGIGTALNIDATGSLHANGSAVFQEATDSTTAFEIQSSDGNTVFTADTANAIITVANLVATGDLTLDGHFITSGSTPTYTAGAAACTSPTISVSGNDTSGTISVQAGSSCTSGDILTVNFATKFGANPHVIITPGGSSAAGLNAYVDDGAISQNGFALGTTATPATGTTYLWNYFVVQ